MTPLPARRLWLASAGLAVLLASATGCGSAAGTTMQPAPASSSSGTTTMPATATEIMIEDFGYSTPPSVAAGSTVSVMNMDGEAHTVTADSGGAFDVVVPAGATVTFTAPTTPGSFAFHCDYHASMHGELVVR